MRYIKHLALLAVLALPLIYSQAQVDAGVWAEIIRATSTRVKPTRPMLTRVQRIKVRPIKVRRIKAIPIVVTLISRTLAQGMQAPPVCPYGYYSYYPYACAPYGFYGPQWFVGGVFIGAGPWYTGAGGMADIGVVVGIGVAAATGAATAWWLRTRLREGMGAEVTAAAMPVTMAAVATDAVTLVAAVPRRRRRSRRWRISGGGGGGFHGGGGGFHGGGGGGFHGGGGRRRTPVTKTLRLDKGDQRLAARRCQPFF